MMRHRGILHIALMLCALPDAGLPAKRREPVEPEPKPEPAPLMLDIEQRPPPASWVKPEREPASVRKQRRKPGAARKHKRGY